MGYTHFYYIGVHYMLTYIDIRYAWQRSAVEEIDQRIRIEFFSEKRF